MAGFGRQVHTPIANPRVRRNFARFAKELLVVDGDGGLQVDGDGKLEIKLADDSGLQTDSDGLAMAAEYNEIPTGAVNGVNDTFTLSREPIPGTIRVMLNGVFMTPGGEDYTLVSTDMIVFEPSQIPQTGDRVVAHYRFRPA